MTQLPPDTDRWNTNIHYHDVLVEAVAPHAGRILDVGCGEGMLCRRLRRDDRAIVGIDTHAESIALARAQSGADGPDYLCADVLTHPFEPASFDAIVSVATLHHLDPDAALTTMARLLKPGGTLAIVGLARPRWPHDLPVEALAVLAFTYHRLAGHRHWEHPSPIVWPPPHTYAEIRDTARALLPGVRYRRHLYWRYSLRWRKPAA